MDIPSGFNDWQWQPWPIQHFVSVTAYRLLTPTSPDWSLVNRWYPECREHKQVNYWVCEIEQQLWSFFEYQTGQWVLMPLQKPNLRSSSPINLGLDLVSATEQNGYQIWLYFSQRPMNLLKRHLKLRLAQKIERIEQLNKPQDLWLLKDNLGRLVFSESEHSEWSFVVLMRVVD